MEFEYILYEKKDGTARVIIDRAKRGNALRAKTLLEMIEAASWYAPFWSRRTSTSMRQGCSLKTE